MLSAIPSIAYWKPRSASFFDHSEATRDSFPRTEDEHVTAVPCPFFALLRGPGPDSRHNSGADHSSLGQVPFLHNPTPNTSWVNYRTYGAERNSNLYSPTTLPLALRQFPERYVWLHYVSTSLVRPSRRKQMPPNTLAGSSRRPKKPLLPLRTEKPSDRHFSY